MPTREELTIKYERLVKKSINNIGSGYFTVANRFRDKPTISERVFCYEFYYQLRKLIEESEIDLQKNEIYFHGELSKIRYDVYGDITPDFLIHNPENDRFNLITIEIKSVLKGFLKEEKPNGIYKDFLSICNLLQNSYQLGIFVLFNHSYNEFLAHWKTKKDVISVEHSELFRENCNSIKLLIKQTANSETVEKPFEDFLDEVNSEN